MLSDRHVVIRRLKEGRKKRVTKGKARNASKVVPKSIRSVNAIANIEIKHEDSSSSLRGYFAASYASAALAFDLSLFFRPNSVPLRRTPDSPSVILPLGSVLLRRPSFSNFCASRCSWRRSSMAN